MTFDALKHCSLYIIIGVRNFSTQISPIITQGRNFGLKSGVPIHKEKEAPWVSRQEGRRRGWGILFPIRLRGLGSVVSSPYSPRGVRAETRPKTVLL